MLRFLHNMMNHNITFSCFTDKNKLGLVLDVMYGSYRREIIVRTHRNLVLLHDMQKSLIEIKLFNWQKCSL